MYRDMQDTLAFYIHQKHTVAAIRTSEVPIHKRTVIRAQELWDCQGEEASTRLRLGDGALAAIL